MNLQTDACLPPEIEDAFGVMCEGVGRIHVELGSFVDEFIHLVPRGQRMAYYELFADVYHRKTGEPISGRTIRAWRHASAKYSRYDLQKYHALSDSQRIEAVKLAEIAKTTPQDICEWCMSTACPDVPTMRAHWLPLTSDDQAVDLPFVTGIIRWATRISKNAPEKLARFNREILPVIREWSRT